MPRLSFRPSHRKTRIGFLGLASTRSGYTYPPRRLTKLPTLLNTLRKALGRSQATEKAAIAPELDPPMPCSSGSLERLYSLESTGISSSVITRAYLSSGVLYSVGRLVNPSPPPIVGEGSGRSGVRPGSINTALITGPPV